MKLTSLVGRPGLFTDAISVTPRQLMVPAPRSSRSAVALEKQTFTAPDGLEEQVDGQHVRRLGEVYVELCGALKPRLHGVPVQAEACRGCRHRPVRRQVADYRLDEARC